MMEPEKALVEEGPKLKRRKVRMLLRDVYKTYQDATRCPHGIRIKEVACLMCYAGI